MPGVVKVPVLSKQHTLIFPAYCNLSGKMHITDFCLSHIIVHVCIIEKKIGKDGGIIYIIKSMTL